MCWEMLQGYRAGEGIRVGGCCRAIELGRDSGGIKVGKDIEDL